MGGRGGAGSQSIESFSQVKGEVACEGELTTGNANGTAIGMNSPDGDNLVGLMDSLRVWRVGRTSSQICEAAGLTCP